MQLSYSNGYVQRWFCCTTVFLFTDKYFVIAFKSFKVSPLLLLDLYVPFQIWEKSLLITRSKFYREQLHAGVCVSLGRKVGWDGMEKAK